MRKKQKRGFAPPGTPPIPLKLHPKRNVKGVSFKIICKIKKLNKSGLAPLVLQYFITGKKTELALNLSIPPGMWNDKRQQLDNKDDENYEHYNLLIEQFRNDFNTVLISLAMEKISPTRDIIKARLDNRASNEDFIKYFDKKHEDRWNKDQIDTGTYRHHRTVVNKCRKFKDKWLFADIDNELIRNFDTWHRKHLRDNVKENGKPLVNGGHNTAEKAKAVIRAYMHLAMDEGIKFTMPVFKINYSKTSRDFCTEAEIKTLVDAYNTDYFLHDQQAVLALERFLFSCATGLRISDIQRVSMLHIKDGCLTFIPHKGRKRQQEINIPILGFIDKILQGKTGKIFGTFAEPVVNRKLKEIARELGIEKSLSMNVGRHTFATLFLQKGGDLVSLQHMLGHGSIRTTQNYLHKDLGHIKRQVEKTLSDIFRKDT